MDGSRLFITRIRIVEKTRIHPDQKHWGGGLVVGVEGRGGGGRVVGVEGRGGVVVVVGRGGGGNQDEKEDEDKEEDEGKEEDEEDEY